MAIYLGESGCIELKRTSVNRPLHDVLRPGDVNPDADRFSFDFKPGALITGDRILMATTDGSPLILFDDGIQEDIRSAYVRVDAIGGITLFESFGNAINNIGKLPLRQHTENQDIVVNVKDLNFNPLAQISEYTITTTRDTVDITCLNEEFKRQYASGLISGQGTIKCFWDYKHGNCDDNSIPSDYELAQYFCQLVLRVQLGAIFTGRFIVHGGEGCNSVWYEGNAIVTNTTLAFVPSQPIVCDIQFVFTEEIQLKTGTVPGLLVQEDADLLLQESLEGAIELEDPFDQC